MTALLRKPGFFACWALLLSWAASLGDLHAQCNNPTPFGTATARTDDVPVTITTCAFAGEYSTINSCVAGSTYRFNATGGSGNYVTVRQGTPGGTVLGHGVPPIDVVCTVSGPLYLHYNTNAACGTDASCHTGTVTCISCSGGANPCSSITTINCNTSTTATVSGSGAWNITACGFSTPGNERIYSFTPTTTGVHNLQVTSTSATGYIDYFIKNASGGCNSSGWTCILDIFSPTTVSMGTLTAGTTYYLLLDAETTSSVTHTFQINCPTPVDACSSITTINCNTAATATLSGSGSWNTTACGFSTPGNERIYSFTAASTGTHSLQVTSTSATGYIDYFIKNASGGCSSSGWTCIDDIFSPTTVSLGTLTAGTTYYILLDAETTTSITHTFQILCPSAAPACVASPTSPTNGQTNICPSATQALSWPASGGATSYDVYFGTTNPPPFVGNTTGTSYTASTPSAPTTYFWQIRPVGPGGTASGCSVWSFTKIDNTLPTITCPANLTVNNAANQCGANVVYGAVTASDNCGAPSLALIGGLASGSFFPVGVTTNTWRATDPSNNTRTCTFTVTVLDVQPPTITCPANIVRPNDPGKCSAVVTYANPTFSDNCSATLSLLSGLASGSTFPVGITTNVFRAIDPAGNSSSCSFTVRVNDVEPPSITCPGPLNLPNDWGQCGRAVNWVGQAVVVDNCGIAANSNNSPGYFAVGSHTVVHIATDGGGNTSTCAQSVTVYDAQPPQVTCPANIVTKTDEGDCVATVSYSATGWDNCPGAVLHYSEDSPGSFGIGYSSVTVSMTDQAGNATSCTFQIRVDARKETCNGEDDDCDGLIDESEEWTKVAKLVASDGGAQDQYGISVDIHNGLAIVGSNQKTPTGQTMGAAYILRRAANGWAQEAKLVAPGLQPGDFFGASVSIHGNTAAVGAPFDDDPVGNEGAVYIFYRSASEDWAFVTKIKAGDPDPADNFGISVALDGDRLIVGANLDDEKGANAGAAYIFYRNQGGADNWGQVAKLTSNPAAADDNFGISVAISGDRAIVGANRVDGLFQDVGAAFVFDRNFGGADNWGQIAKLSPSNGGQNDNFGASVGISGLWAIVGADQNDQKGNNAGAAYIFYQNQLGIQNSWGQSNLLLDYNGSAGKRFGSGVAIEGDYAVVGAKGDSPFGPGSGRGFVYIRFGNSWVPAGQLTDGAGQANDNLGTAAAISGGAIILGAPLDDIGAKADQGSVSIFEGVCTEEFGSPMPDDRNAVTPAPNQALRCYPVPFSDVLTVEVNGLASADAQLTVVNALGQVLANVYNGSIAGNMVFQWMPTASTPPGMYFMRLMADGKVTTVPVVLSR